MDIYRFSGISKSEIQKFSKNPRITKICKFSENFASFEYFHREFEFEDYMGGIDDEGNTLYFNIFHYIFLHHS